MLTVMTWLWGDKFGPDYVAKLKAGVRRHLKQSHRFLCVTDEDLSAIGVETTIIKDPGLAKMKGCFCRLRTFDPEWQKDIGIDDRVLQIDLDTVITGALDPIVDRDEPFLIMQGGNAVNPCPYNGALMLLRAAAHPEVWAEFTLARARALPFHEFPDDQGWIAHMLPNAPGWRVGPKHGVYVYKKPGWPAPLPYKLVAPGHPRYAEFTRDSSDDLPDGARLVTFINRDPKTLTHLDWVKANWAA